MSAPVRTALALALLVAPLAGAAAQTAAAKRTAITGVVVDDGGRPLANAAVQATPIGDFDYLNRATAAADEEGRFSIGGLEPTPYRLYAEANGYVRDRDEDEGPYYRPGDAVTIRMVKGGVITGTVTGPEGEPLVGVAVRALRVRAEAGDRVSPYEYARTTYADDRGIYRIYGLAAGGYVVSACGTQPYALTFTVYDADAPTFYPASTRADATEVTVHTGEEVRGIDIRHRGAASHSISGTVSGVGAKIRYANVVVMNASDGQMVTTANVRRGGEPWTFEVPGVADGEYLVRAGAWSDDLSESAPRRVVVKGADVTGVALTLEPLATLEGRVVVDAPAAEGGCAKPEQERSKQETVVSLVPEAPPSGDSSRRVVQRDTAPGRDDAFSYKGVPLARYRFDVRPPNDDLYVAAIRQQKGAAKSAVVDLGREGVRVASGERITGVTVEMSRGAAKVSGKVETPAGGALPDGLLVHLVPAGAADAENALRYREMKTARDGEFAFANVAPGKYWLLARPAPESDPARPSRAAWRADTRAALRRDAEKAGHAIELVPCQRAERISLSVGPPLHARGYPIAMPHGPSPTRIVATTSRVAVSMTETVFDRLLAT